jgi:hypothetical protein
MMMMMMMRRRRKRRRIIMAESGKSRDFHSDGPGSTPTQSM